MASLQVGQKLLSVVDFRHGRRIDPPQQSEVAVTKVGRKYADLNSGDRLILDTMTIDGGQYTSPGKCYLSKDVYDASEGATLAWRNLKNSMGGWDVPAGVTVADIEAARALLKV